jgi:hypothetical protein
MDEADDLVELVAAILDDLALVYFDFPFQLPFQHHYYFLISPVKRTREDRSRTNAKNNIRHVENIRDLSTTRTNEDNKGQDLG